RHTRSKRDWSSDVCSSDLALWPKFAGPAPGKIVNLSIAFLAPGRYNATIGSNGAVSHLRLAAPFVCVRHPYPPVGLQAPAHQGRSEERRVGKGGRRRSEGE